MAPALIAPPPHRHRFLTGAGGRHRAWLADSGLSPRTCRTYTQQVSWYLGWLARHPGNATDLCGTPAARWYATGTAGLTAQALGETQLAARQRGADKAADAYHRHLLDRGAAPASIKLAMSAIGSLHGALGLRPPYVENRMGTRPYTRPRTLTAAERERVLAAAQRRGTRDLALTALADDAGLRPGEIVTLDLPDVSPDADAVCVRGSTYAHRDRVVPVTAPVARAALAAWRSERAALQAGTPALFVSRRGQRLTLRTVEHVIQQAGAAAGVRVAPGTLRNTRTAQLADDGLPAWALAARFGHLSAETLRPYEPPVIAGPPSAAAVGGRSEQRSLPGPAAE
jgi:site-specific recombinase XerD